MIESDDDLRRFRELMDRAIVGSEEAAAELVARYGDALQRAVRRALSRRLRTLFDSLDFSQMVWLSFFRPTRDMPRFDRPNQLIAFLTGMAKRKVAAEARNRLVRPRHNLNREISFEESIAEASEVPDRRPGPMELAMQKEAFERFLSQRSPRDRRMVELRLKGLTEKQVATRLGLALNTVRRHWTKLFGF